MPTVPRAIQWSIAVTILLAGFSVSIYLAEQAKIGASTKRAELDATCAERGSEAFERWKARLLDVYETPGLIDPPEYHFNTRLNTCLMKVGHWTFIPYSGKGPSEQNSDLLNSIIDVYTNKTLIDGGHANRWKRDDGGQWILGGDMTGSNPVDFKEKARVLMSE